MTIWDCRTHVRMTSMTSSVKRTDLDFKICVALWNPDFAIFLTYCENHGPLCNPNFAIFRTYCENNGLRPLCSPDFAIFRTHCENYGLHPLCNTDIATFRTYCENHYALCVILTLLFSGRTVHLEGFFNFPLIPMGNKTECKHCNEKTGIFQWSFEWDGRVVIRILCTLPCLTRVERDCRGSQGEYYKITGNVWVEPSVGLQGANKSAHWWVGNWKPTRAVLYSENHGLCPCVTPTLLFLGHIMRTMGYAPCVTPTLLFSGHIVRTMGYAPLCNPDFAIFRTYRENHGLRPCVTPTLLFSGRIVRTMGYGPCVIPTLERWWNMHSLTSSLEDWVKGDSQSILSKQCQNYEIQEVLLVPILHVNSPDLA